MSLRNFLDSLKSAPNKAAEFAPAFGLRRTRVPRAAHLVRYVHI